jgi:hypothetical protein
MTTKEHFINHLRKARTQHLKWLSQIKLLVSGVAVDKEQIAVNPSEAAFGLWLYDEAMVFSGNAGSSALIEEIESLYLECFDRYFKIYHTLPAKSSGFVSAILGAKKASAAEMTVAQQYYEDLVGTSDGLINRLRRFESQLLATSEAKFAELLLSPELEEDQIDLVGQPKLRGNVQRMYRGQPVD